MAAGAPAHSPVTSAELMLRWPDQKDTTGTTGSRGPSVGAAKGAGEGDDDRVGPGWDGVLSEGVCAAVVTAGLPAPLTVDVSRLEAASAPTTRAASSVAMPARRLE